MNNQEKAKNSQYASVGVKHRGAMSVVGLGIFVLAFLNFSIFLIFDPSPNLLLALCTSLNIILLSVMIFHLYQSGILLSPIGCAVIGPGWILFYSVGNLGARIAGSTRFAANYGSLEYYPDAALLTTLGLWLMFLTVFVIFKPFISSHKIKYKDMRWNPRQIIAVLGFAIIILFYLSSKYSFTGGYFRNVQGTVDQWLVASSNAFIALSVVVSVSTFVNRKTIKEGYFSLFCLAIAILITVSMQSRTFTLQIIILAVLCYISLVPKLSISAVIFGILLTLVLFGAGTVIKLTGVAGQAQSMQDNINLVLSINFSSAGQLIQVALETDSEYRLAGLEYPAALLKLFDHNAIPLLGQGMVGGIMQGLPDFLRPSGSMFSERIAISLNFLGTGILRYSDTIGVPLTSGLADWAAFGVFIYVIIGLYCIIMWRFMQSSIYISLAYIMLIPSQSLAAGGIGDLFWEQAASLIKTLVFVVCVLFIFRRLLMPSLVRNIEMND